MLNSIKAVVWSVLGLLLVGAGLLVYFGLPKGEETNYPVEMGTITRTARGTGRIEGLSEVTLCFGRPGMVQAVNVSEGQEVEINQDLADLHAGEAEVQIAQDQAKLNEAEAKLALAGIPRSAEAIQQAEERHVQAEEEVKLCDLRLAALKEPAAPPKAPAWQLEEAARAVEKATQNRALAQAALEQLTTPPPDQASIAEANFNLAKAELEDAQKILAEYKSFTPPTGKESKAQLEAKVEIARRNLAKTQAEWDRLKHDPPPQETKAAKARVALTQKDLESAQAIKARLEDPEAPAPAPDTAVEVLEARIALRQAQSRERETRAAWEELKRPPAEAAAKVKVAEAAKEYAEKTLKLTRLYREGLKLRAPFSGLVTKRYIEPGTLVNPAMPAVTVLDFSQKRVRAEFDIALLPSFKKDMVVRVTSRPLDPKGRLGPASDLKGELTGWPLSGKLEKILGVGSRKLLLDDPSAPKGGEVFEVLIALEEPQTELKKNSYALLRPGLRVDVDVVLEERKDVLVIPKTYISREQVPGPDGRPVEPPFVWLHVPGAKDATRRMVQLGMKDDLMQEILEGLVKGDQIVKPKSANR